MTETEKPNVEELYTVAGAATNLRVEADTRGAADYLIAAAWSPSRLGAAMLRLHTEWDTVAKPKKPTRDEIHALASTMRRADGKPDHERAQKLGAEWYAAEVANLVERLRSLPYVREQVAIKAYKWGMADPVEMAGAIVRYWLDQTCHPCAGLKFRAVSGAPALSAKVCPVCRGSGLSQVPYGNEGKRLANYMDDCVNRAQASIRSRLIHYR